MTAIDNIINQWNGKALDTDGFPPTQPFQCYDVFIEYIRLLSGNPSLYFTATQTGFASDIYTQYDSSALLQSLFDKLPFNATGQRGDVGVWGVAAQTPYTHVALILQDKGTIQNIFGQNQPYPYCTTRDFTSQGLLGYLRPKTNQGEDNMPVKISLDTWRILANGVLARNGVAGRQNALSGTSDADGNANHVGHDLTNEYIQGIFLSDEGRQWRDSNDINAVTGINTRLAYNENADKQIADLHTQVNGDAILISDLQAKLAQVLPPVTQPEVTPVIPEVHSPTMPPFVPTPPLDYSRWFVRVLSWIKSKLSK